MVTRARSDDSFRLDIYRISTKNQTLDQAYIAVMSDFKAMLLDFFNQLRISFFHYLVSQSQTPEGWFQCMIKGIVNFENIKIAYNLNRP